MSGPNETLPQLYRFCYLMTGDAGLAEQSFQAAVREAARRSTRAGAVHGKARLFREARRHCLNAVKGGVQPEPITLPEEALATGAALQASRVAPVQLAAWIASAPEPQRSALALHYLNEFSYREIMELLGLRMRDLASLLALSRRQMQAWLNAVSELVVP